MLDKDFVILVVQIIAALGVVVSVVYLGLQIRQQNIITKAQFGHSLTQRLYDRYFQTSKDLEYAKFMSKDWSKPLQIIGQIHFSCEYGEVSCIVCKLCMK